MKKLFLSLLSLVISMTMFAQSNVRKMNLIYDGQVVYSRAVSLIDSIKFVWSDGSGSGDDITGGEVDPSKQLYVGVVAFNRDVRQMAITSDMEAVKAFINEQTNDKDFTAFAYSVSQGNKQFDAAGLPEFDNIFMLNFSDGTDNYSNMKWGEEGRMVAPNVVYDTARYDLLQRAGLNSYAIGFGNDVGFGEKMKKVVTGSGGYYNAKSSNDLQSTFNEIAKSMLASAKNVLLKTNPGYYSGYYKYFRFKFTAEGGYTDVIYAQMDGTPTTGYTLAISKIENGYAYFDAPAKGVVDDETGKVHIPLNNLKFVKDGKELQYKYTIEVSFDGELYYEDVEEASTAEEISKRIAVVLVLDCSTSMGDAFEPMKAAAVDFIKTMEKMEVDDSEPKDITVKAKVPATWTETITAWVWPTGGDGQEVVPTKEGDWYVYTRNCAELNIIFKNGAGWTGNANQTVDMTFTENACVEITSNGAKLATYTNVECDSEKVYEYVDLGLSVKWATCNVGASKPEEYGDYFAWGETTTKSTYNWSTYKYCNGSYNTLTKYNNSSSYGSVDNKTTLELADDAARANWGGSWRMPTDAEMIELHSNCTWTLTTQNGVNGYKVTSKKNGNSIFLPAAGYRGDSSLSHAGSYGFYWSSSLHTGCPYSACYLYFDSDHVDRYGNNRYYGYSVRPVCQ